MTSVEYFDRSMAPRHSLTATSVAASRSAAAKQETQELALLGGTPHERAILQYEFAHKLELKACRLFQELLTVQEPTEMARLVVDRVLHDDEGRGGENEGHPRDIKVS